MFTPTIEQNMILDESGSFVVVALPGSGKTTTMAYKIKSILNDHPHFKGVIGISYTNKASDELKKRSLEGGVDVKGSFFGTIDKFYISEILLPFSKHLFGKTSIEIEIVKCKDETTMKKINFLLDIGYIRLEEKHVNWIINQYMLGVVYLEMVGMLSLYILSNSFACRRYIKSRYSHVIIDEYQDSGFEQHELFIKLQQIGLFSIAVGDVNQSIYAFSKKDSRYLLMLTQNEQFKTFSLTYNRRCHTSIINYSTRLLSDTFISTLESSINVYEKCIEGSEVEIAKWLSVSVPSYMNMFNIMFSNKVGILVRGNKTGGILDTNVTLKHKYFQTTPLDEESSLWGTVFRKILHSLFNPNYSKYELIEQYFDTDIKTVLAKKAMLHLSVLFDVTTQNPNNLIEHLVQFINIAKLIHPTGENKNAINILTGILNSAVMMDSFKPASQDEVQIMTLHKSKGLEFDLVFHLDLYKHILPMYNGDYIQDINLHYVGITRAKQCCVLCTSTQRHGQYGIRNAEPSDFFYKNDLQLYRGVSPF